MDPLIETRLREVFPTGDVECPERSAYLTEEVDPVICTFLEQMRFYREIRFDRWLPFASDRLRRLAFVPKEAPSLWTWWFDARYDKIRWLEEHGGVLRAMFVDVSLVIPVVRTTMHAWRVDSKTGSVAPVCERGPCASPWSEFREAVVSRLERLWIAEMPDWFSTTEIPYVRACEFEEDSPAFSSDEEPETGTEGGEIGEDDEIPKWRSTVLEECLFWY